MLTERTHGADGARTGRASAGGDANPGVASGAATGRTDAPHRGATGPSDVGPWNTDGPLPFRCHGDDVQAVEFVLAPGQELQCEPGAFIMAAGGVTQLDLSWGRGLLAPVRRVWSGEAGILTRLVCRERPASVLLGTSQIGRIVRLEVRPGAGMVAQRGAFMAASGRVDLSIAFVSRLSAGLFGGGGLVFQRLTGDGDAFLHAQGAVTEWWVAADEEVLVATHRVLAFSESVGYEVRLSGGPLTWLFGGEGVFLTALRGPGRVIVQSIDTRAARRGRAARWGEHRKETGTARRAAMADTPVGGAR